MNKGVEILLSLIGRKGITELHDMNKRGKIAIKFIGEKKLRYYDSVWHAVEQVRLMPDCSTNHLRRKV